MSFWQRLWRKREEADTVFWEGRPRSILGRFTFFVRNRFVTPRLVKIVMQRTTRGTIAEVGCGTAYGSVLISARRGDRVIALDNSGSALALAQGIAKENGVQLDWLLSDILSMPLRDDAVDLAWNIGTLEHFPDPQPLLREMKRIARMTICIVPAWSLGWVVSLRLLALLGYYNPEYMRYHDAKSLASAFRQAGFEAIEVGRVMYLPFCPCLVGIGRKVVVEEEGAHIRQRQQHAF